MADYKYKRTITLSPATPVADYQVKIVLNTTNFDYSNCNSDGSDLRFYQTDDTELSYWIENWDTSGESIIWVKVATSGTSSIEMRYGNPDAESMSNIDDTMVFGDDFSGTSLDTTKWSGDTSNTSISNGILTINASNPINDIRANWLSSSFVGYIFESYAHISSSSYGGDGCLLMVTDASLSNFITIGGSGAATYIQKGAKRSGTGTYESLISNTSDWHLWKMYGTTSTVHYCYEDTCGTLTTNIPTVSLPYIRITGAKSASTQFKWIRVRKYATTEPATTIGSETSTYSSIISLSYIKNTLSVELDSLSYIKDPLSLNSLSYIKKTLSVNLNSLSYVKKEFYKYTRAISLSPATPVADYQVKIVLNTTNFDYSNCNSDGSDLRFYQTDNTELSYWIEKWNTSGESIIWVKVATSGTSSIEMRYGNPDASSASNGDNTFEFFDDFEDGTIDTNKWAIGGNMSESGGVASGSISGTDYLFGKIRINIDTLTLIKIKNHSTATNARPGVLQSPGNPYSRPGFGWQDYMAGDRYTDTYYTAVNQIKHSTYNTGWYTLESIWQTGSVKFYVDGSLLVTHTSQIPPSSMVLYGQIDGDADYDLFYTRKYISPEPAATIGSETYTKNTLSVHLESLSYIKASFSSLLNSSSFIEVEGMIGSINSVSFIKTTEEGTIVSESFIKKVFVESINSGSYVKKEFTESLSSESYVKDTFSEPLPSETYIKDTFTTTLNSESYILWNYSETLSSSSYVKANISQTQNSTSYIHTTLTTTITSSSYIVIGAKHHIYTPHTIKIQNKLTPNVYNIDRTEGIPEVYDISNKDKKPKLRQTYP